MQYGLLFCEISSIFSPLKAIFVYVFNYIQSPETSQLNNNKRAEKFWIYMYIISKISRLLFLKN